MEVKADYFMNSLVFISHSKPSLLANNTHVEHTSLSSEIFQCSCQLTHLRCDSYVWGSQTLISVQLTPMDQFLELSGLTNTLSKNMLTQTTVSTEGYIWGNTSWSRNQKMFRNLKKFFGNLGTSLDMIKSF